MFVYCQRKSFKNRRVVKDHSYKLKFIRNLARQEKQNKTKILQKRNYSDFKRLLASIEFLRNTSFPFFLCLSQIFDFIAHKN